MNTQKIIYKRSTLCMYIVICTYDISICSIMKLLVVANSYITKGIKGISWKSQLKEERVHLQSLIEDGGT